MPSWIAAKALFPTAILALCEFIGGDTVGGVGVGAGAGAGTDAGADAGATATVPTCPLEVLARRLTPFAGVPFFWEAFLGVALGVDGLLLGDFLPLLAVFGCLGLVFFLGGTLLPTGFRFAPFDAGVIEAVPFAMRLRSVAAACKHASKVTAGCVLCTDES